MTDQQSLVEIAAEKITEEILAGSLRPGDRVSEPRVSESLGMSRPPLREALRVLETRVGQFIAERRTDARPLSYDHWVVELPRTLSDGSVLVVDDQGRVDYRRPDPEGEPDAE